MAGSPSSKIAAASIPNITALRKDLDYGNSRLQRCTAFYDDVRVFRKKFRTAQGIPGVDLHQWKSREHQTGLDEMTDAYLNKEGNGAVFWPDQGDSPNRNKWSYSKHRLR
jgi:hypothetical protein